MKVGEVLRQLRADGWMVVRPKGSHRQLHHPTKAGTVTVAGRESTDVSAEILASIRSPSGLLSLRWRSKGGLIVREYLVVFEKGPTSWGAYAPDFPGCIAVGNTKKEVEALFGEALEMHIELMRESGELIPEPAMQAGVVSVAA